MDGKYSFERMENELDNGHIIFTHMLETDINYSRHQKIAIHSSY